MPFPDETNWRVPIEGVEYLTISSSGEDDMAGDRSVHQHSTRASLFDQNFNVQASIGSGGAPAFANALFSGFQLGHETVNSCNDHAEMRALEYRWVGIGRREQFNIVVGIDLNEFPCSYCHRVLKALTTVVQGEAGPRFQRIIVRLMDGTSTAYQGDHGADARGENIDPPVLIHYMGGRATYTKRPRFQHLYTTVAMP